MLKRRTLTNSSLHTLPAPSMPSFRLHFLRSFHSALDSVFRLSKQSIGPKFVVFNLFIQVCHLVFDLFSLLESLCHFILFYFFMYLKQRKKSSLKMVADKSEGRGFLLAAQERRNPCKPAMNAIIILGVGRRHLMDQFL